MTLEDFLREHAQNIPDKCAIVCGPDQVTYGQLWKDIVDCAEQLSSGGLESHRPYVFRASQDARFIVTYCAIHLLHAVAVPLEHSVSDEVFNKVKDEVEACQFADDICDTLYTTGTSGQAKGVMLSQTCLAACADNFIKEMNFHPALVFMVSGPLNHIASLFKIHPILTVGGTLCVLDGLRDMNAFFQVFTLPYKHFATFLVPSSIRMLLQFSAEQLHAVAHLIDFIETGAAPISSADMQHLSSVLPDSRLYNTYGGTEIGCACTYQFNDGKYLEACVGRPMLNARVHLDDGKIVVSGKTIMSGYVGDPERTASILRNGSIYTSDLGAFDSEGRLHLRGRADDLINVGGFKIAPTEIEEAALSHPDIKDCICVPVPHDITGQALKLIVVLKEGCELNKRSIALHLKQTLESFKIPALYEVADNIRRTFNGKLDRKSYRQ